MMGAFEDREIGGQTDPLKVGPAAGRELMKRISAAANGFSRGAVMDVAANLLVNNIRQSKSTAQGAAEAWDEVSSKIKSLLMSHYWPGPLGKRRSVFPFDQVIEVPRLIDREP